MEFQATVGGEYQSGSRESLRVCHCGTTSDIPGIAILSHKASAGCNLHFGK